METLQRRIYIVCPVRGVSHEEQKFLDLLKEEAKVDLPGFYDLHVLAKKYKTELPRMEKILSTLNAVRTHFSPYGIKTEKNIKDVSTVMLS